MNINLTRAQAKAVAAVLHDHLEDWCSIPGVDRDDVAEALRLIEVATYTASVKLKPARDPIAEAAPAMFELLRDMVGCSNANNGEGLINCLETARGIIEGATA